MHIVDKLGDYYLALSARDRIRIQALAGLGPAAALTPLLIIVGERYGYIGALAVGFSAIIILAYVLIFLRSKVGDKKFFLAGFCSLLICWVVSIGLFFTLL